ncbi:MAG: hypothetical protein ABI477_24125 [Chryseolinea sp.]
MKFKLFCCFCMLFAASQVVQAQDQNASGASMTFSVQEKPFVAPPEPPTPLFIINIDGKTLEIDPDVNKIPVDDLLDQNAINSIQIISGDEGEMRYGHKGRNGVIIVNYKEFSILPAAFLQIKDGDGE